MSEHRTNGHINGERRRKLLRGLNGSARPERELPLQARLRAIEESLATDSIDEVWVFPPLPDRDVACEFILVTSYDGSPDRRRVHTAHVEAEFEEEGDELRWVQRVREHGVVPREWVSRIPDRLLARLEAAGMPEVIEIGGAVESWEATLARFAGANGGNGRTETGGASATARDNGRVDSHEKA